MCLGSLRDRGQFEGERTVQAVVATPLKEHGQADLCQHVAAVIAARPVPPCMSRRLSLYICALTQRVAANEAMRLTPR